MVPLDRIGLSTPSLPRKCSTTELQRRRKRKDIRIIFRVQAKNILLMHFFLNQLLFFKNTSKDDDNV